MRDGRLTTPHVPAPTHALPDLGPGELLTPAEACALLGLDRLHNPQRKLWLLTRKGLPYVDLGLRQRYYRRADLVAYVEAQTCR